jgi:hypothetical protein
LCASPTKTKELNPSCQWAGIRHECFQALD